MNMRSIFISGANQGLGLHTALQLSHHPNILLFLGSRKIDSMNLAIKDFNNIGEGTKVVPLQLDVTDQKSVEEATKEVKKVLEETGKKELDVLINNAGTLQGSIQDVFAVNVFGVLTLTTSLRPLLSRSGSIINISSNMGSSAYWSLPKPLLGEKILAYGSSKSALNSLTMQWAAEERLKESKRRVVAICPGYTATNFNAYSGTSPPEESCKIIVEAAMQEEGENGVFYNKAGKLVW